MAEIKNKITIDTTGAITSIESLDKALQNFGQNLGNMAKGLGTSLKQLSSGEFDKAKKSVDALSRSMNKIKGTGAKKAAQGLREVGARGKEAEAIMNRFVSSARRAQTLNMRGLSNSLRAAAQALKAGNFKGAFAAIKAGANNAQGAMQKFGKGAKSAIDLAKGAADRFTKGFVAGFKNILRVVKTQAIVSAFGALRRAMSEGFNSALKFEESLREVNAILSGTDSMKNNLEGLEAQVRGISEAFSIPLDQVVEGQYQVISNQVADAAGSVDVLEASAKFARLTMADLGDSVTAVSGAINAFNLTAADSEEIAAKYFATIQQGKVRGDQLTQSLGRVLPTAKELGISMSELLAAFSAITLSGLSEAEAITQLRGAMRALQKPTQALRDRFREWGVTAESLIAQEGGLIGAFQKMRDATDGTQASLAKLIPRIRGMNGVLLTTNENAAKVEKAFKAIDNATSIFDEEYNFFIDSDAETVRKEMTKLANVVTIELGRALVGMAKKLIDAGFTAEKFRGIILSLVGFIENKLIPNIKGITLSLVALAGAFTGAKIGSALAALGVTLGGIATVLGPLAVPIAAAAVALTGVVLVAKKFKEATEAGTKAIREQEQAHKDNLKAATDAAKEGAKKQIELYNEISSKVQDFLDTSVREYRKAYNENNLTVQEHARYVEESYDAILSAVVNNASEQVKATDKALKEQVSLQEDATKKIADIRSSIEEKKALASVAGFDDVSASTRLAQQANIKAREAARKLAAATTKQDVAAAEALFKQAESLASAAQSRADSSGNAVAIRKASEASLGVDKQRLSALQQQQRALQQNTRELQQQKGAQEQQLKDLKKLVDEALEIDLAGKTGQALDEATAQLDDKVGQIGALIAEGALDEKAMAQAGIDAGTIYKARLEAQLAKRKINVSESFDVKGLRAKIQTELDGLKAVSPQVAIAIQWAEGVTGKPVNSVDELINEMSEKLSAAFQKQNAVRVEAELHEKETEAAWASMIGRMQTVADGLKIQAFGGLLELDRGGALFNFEGQIQSFNSLIQMSQHWIEQMREGTTIANEGVQALIDKFNSIAQNDQVSAEMQERARLAAETLQKALELQGQRTDKEKETSEAANKTAEETASAQRWLNAAMQNSGPLAEYLNQAGDGAEKTNDNMEGVGGKAREMGAGLQKAGEGAQKAATKTGEIGKQANNANGAIGTMPGTFSLVNSAIDGTIRKMGELEAAAKRAAAAVAAANSGEVNVATGRYMYRACGGNAYPSRGTDTIPAMLSPGEFVVNARSSRKFFSELQAINSGKQPVYRAEGGPVGGDTISVGDINVNYQGDSNSVQSVTDFARRIRREIRKGGVKFN